VPEDSREAGEANEDSGRGDREFFSAAKPLSTVTAGMVAMVSQHTILKDVLDVLRIVIKKK
jgi:hypothetical protein